MEPDTTRSCPSCCGTWTASAWLLLPWCPAVAATASITTSLDPRDTARHSSISSWLGKHGGQLTSLSIRCLRRIEATAASVASSNDDLEDDGSVSSEYLYSYRNSLTDREPPPTVGLQLPLQQLRQLRSLKLAGIRLLPTSSIDGRTGSTGAQADADTPARPLPPSPKAGNQQQHSAQQQRQQQLEGPTTTPGNASSGNSSPPQSSPFFGLSVLTSLQLDNVVMVGFEGGLRCLSVLTGLQRLQLGQGTLAAAPGRAAAAYYADWSGSGEELGTANYKERSTGFAAALFQLRQLTHLSFRRMSHLHDADLAPLSRLQQLKEFKCHSYLNGWYLDCVITHASFAVLPPSLTMLEVLGAYHVNLGCTTTPSLMHNTQLQHLEVYGGGGCDYIEPALLRSLVALTHLTLEGESSWQGLVGPFSCLLQLRELKIVGTRGVSGSTLAGLPATLTRLEFDWGQFDSSFDTNAPLRSSSVPGLHQLTGLQHLVVHARTPPGDLQHYLALLSPSNLTYLHLDTGSRMVRPEAQQLLREQAQQLLHLKHLKL